MTRDEIHELVRSATGEQLADHIERQERSLETLRRAFTAEVSARAETEAEVATGARLCADRQERINDLEAEVARLRGLLAAAAPQPEPPQAGDPELDRR